MRILGSLWVACLLLMRPSYAQDIVPIVPIRIVGMKYPGLAMAVGIRGDLKINCIISSDGKVVSAEIAEAKSRPFFEDRTRGVRDLLGKPAQENVLQWIFPSSTSQSQRSVTLLFKFDLIGKADPSKGTKFVFDSPDTVTITAEVSDVILESGEAI